MLTEYKTWYDKYRQDMGDQWKETDRLFIAECGGRLYPGTIQNWVHKICEAAGLPHRTVHSLRHTNITMQIAAGVPLVTVAGRAGHARISTTTDTYSHFYSHFLKSSDKAAAEKLEQLFGQQTKRSHHSVKAGWWLIFALVWRWGAIPTLQSPACECRLRHLCSQ